MECGGAKDRVVIAAYTNHSIEHVLLPSSIDIHIEQYITDIFVCVQSMRWVFTPATSARCPVSRMPATDSFAKTRPATSHIDLPPPAEDTFNDHSLVKLYVRPREVCDLNLSEKSCKKST